MSSDQLKLLPVVVEDQRHAMYMACCFPAVALPIHIFRAWSPESPYLLSPLIRDTEPRVYLWFLNNTKLATAIIYAKDEPIQLATLMKVPALSKSGANAGKELMGNFPSIVSNLNSVQSGAISTQDATMAVNSNRCCTILPAIGMLWTAVTIATGCAAMPILNLQDQCGKMSCANGISTGPANMTLQTVVHYTVLFAAPRIPYSSVRFTV